MRVSEEHVYAGNNVFEYLGFFFEQEEFLLTLRSQLRDGILEKV